MKEESNPQLYAIRHSLAHVLAQAVKTLYPDAKLGFGPPTDTGFFYDFDFGDKKISESDLKPIEKAMKKIIGKKQEFQRELTDYEGALKKLEDSAESYKVENVQNLNERGISEFSFYTNGPFLDVCEGPHVANTGELPAKSFKLDRVAGAYWLGDETKPMLTRIYALAFETPEQLQEFIKRRATAQEFDHKKLGKELELFYFDDHIGKGLPLWLPNGAIVRDEIENYAKEMEFKGGYQRVITPTLAKEELYLKSQHLPAYEESMYPPITCKNDETGHEEKYYLRPMNCPHHHLVYSSRKRSYKELPMRVAEYGTTYRFEQSGELSGLIRVRGMTLNDAHIYCRLEQVEQEMKNILALYMELYETFKLKDYSFRLSIRDKEKSSEKYRGDDKTWTDAEEILLNALKETQLPYYIGEGEAAFYGPKIDIQFKNLMGREETVSTIQLDFLGPENFDLNYTDEQGHDVRPVIIHRSPLSTHERFVSFLIEYYGGAFPTWLAPVQVCLIPVNDTCKSYCEELAEELRSHMVRVELDDSSNSFGKKIRTNTVRKIPMLLIIGNDEVEQGQVTVRRYGLKEQQTLDKSEFKTSILEEIRLRKNFREPMGSII